MPHAQLPIPTHFDPQTVKDFWRVPYGDRAAQAQLWAQQYNLQPAAEDTTRICLLAIDVQTTFCIPGFELFVGGSGMGAVDDSRRLCEFIHRWRDYSNHANDGYLYGNANFPSDFLGECRRGTSSSGSDDDHL